LLAISSITYYAIEQPCRKWINRLGGNMLKRPRLL
jgi:peptidoglycan/LPS O-acetylase OafA/YrhL